MPESGCVFCGEEAPSICDICSYPVCHDCSMTCQCGAQACNDCFNPMEQLCNHCLAERDGTPPPKDGVQ